MRRRAAIASMPACAASRWTPSASERVGAARRERRDHLPGGRRHLVGRIVGVDLRDVGGERRAAVAARRHLLGARDRALDRVGLDDDVGDLREHFLLVLQPVAVDAPTPARAARSTAASAAPTNSRSAPSARLATRGWRAGLSSAARARSAVNSVRRLLQQPRRDEHPVDLVGPLVDARDARVAVHALERELARVAVAAEHLHPFVHRPGERLARPHLVDRALDREALRSSSAPAGRRRDRRPRARGRRRRACDTTSRRRRSARTAIPASFCLIRPNSAIALPNWRRSFAYLTA